MKKNNLNNSKVSGAKAVALNWKKFLEKTQKESNEKRQPGDYEYNAALNFIVALCKNGKLKKPDDTGHKDAAKAAIEGTERKAKQVQEFFEIKHYEGTYSVKIFCKNIAEINKLERRLKKLQEFTDYLVSIFERDSRITTSQAELFFYIGLVLSEAERMKKELIA